MDKRGFESVEEMNEYIIRKWNDKVKKRDEVVILGDFSYGTVEQTNDILKRINGRLYMIVGNHDAFLMKKSAETSRFQWIKNYAELSDNNRKVIVCHYPIMCYNGQYSLDKNGNPKSYMLYGHVHNTTDEKLVEQYVKSTRNTQTIGLDGEKRYIPCNMINCFCMYSDYTPLSLDEWIELTEKRYSRNDEYDKK